MSDQETAGDTKPDIESPPTYTAEPDIERRPTYTATTDAPAKKDVHQKPLQVKSKQSTNTRTVTEIDGKLLTYASRCGLLAFFALCGGLGFGSLSRLYVWTPGSSTSRYRNGIYTCGFTSIRYSGLAGTEWSREYCDGYSGCSSWDLGIVTLIFWILALLTTCHGWLRMQPFVPNCVERYCQLTVSPRPLKWNHCARGRVAFLASMLFTVSGIVTWYQGGDDPCRATFDAAYDEYGNGIYTGVSYSMICGFIAVGFLLLAGIFAQN